MISSHLRSLRRRAALFAAATTMGMLPAIPARGDDPVHRAVNNANNSINNALSKFSTKVNTLGGLLGPHRKKTPERDFGDVPVSTSEDVQILSIAHNVGGPAGGYILAVDSVDISGRDKNDFQIIESNDIGPHKDGDESIIKVRFSPSRKGTEKARLEEHVHSLSGGNAWSVPLDLVGNGVGRPFFYIAYLNTDKTDPNMYQSFPDAAATWESEIKAKYNFDPQQDKFIKVDVLSADDFVKAWNDIYKTTTQGKDKYKVIEGAIFSHSSEPGLSLSHGYVVESGLEFGSDPGVDPATAGSTVTKGLIDALSKLNWDKSGDLELFGCNTAVMRDVPNWSPAGEFASDQNVTTLGENGFASFSENKDTYVEISAGSKNVYLEAFDKFNTHLGIVVGSKARIPPVSFKPPTP